MRIMLSGLAAAFALFFADAPTAAAEAIMCPLSTATRTITNDLPAGWWTTPIVENLSSTQISTIAGKPALVCVYGHAGTIQRYAPEGQVCTARRGGFNCVGQLSPSPSAAPQTHSTGQRDVPQTYVIDLDNGQVGGSDGGDIWFHAVTNTELYIEPRSGAQMAVGDRSNRGFDGCSSASFSTARVPLSDIPVGSYVCVRTNEGRISQFRMNAISSGSPKTLTIGYTTWR